MSEQPVHQAPASDPEGAETPVSSYVPPAPVTPSSDPSNADPVPSTETTADAGTGNPASDPIAGETPATGTESTADVGTDNIATTSDSEGTETPGVTETSPDASTAGGGTNEGSDAPTAAEVTASNSLASGEHTADAAPSSDPMGSDTPPTTGF